MCNAVYVDDLGEYDLVYKYVAVCVCVFKCAESISMNVVGIDLKSRVEYREWIRSVCYCVQMILGSSRVLVEIENCSDGKKIEVE